MYRGFNLELTYTNENLYQKGRTLNAHNKLKVKRALDSFMSPDGSLDGSKMKQNWFPQVEADVFISHSHQDEKTAITLAGWLSVNFGIKPFIDSCIWGYSNDLLKIIDNKYCLNPNGETYNYHKRNFSTRHVHIMLATALNMMIDKTECLFFLNTPSSITTSKVVDQTESPWIYSEIAMSQMVRQKTPRRRMIHETQYFSKGGGLNENLKIKYDVSLAHLSDINVDTLNKWLNEDDYTDADAALDALYSLRPLRDLNIIGG